MVAPSCYCATVVNGFGHRIPNFFAEVAEGVSEGNRSLRTTNRFHDVIPSETNAGVYRETDEVGSRDGRGWLARPTAP